MHCCQFLHYNIVTVGHVMATVLLLVLCEYAQHCGGLVIILLYQKTLKMIPMMILQYPISCASKTYEILLLCF